MTDLSQATAPRPAPAVPNDGGKAFGAIAVCTLIWGTTWFAITLQLGPVPPTISVIYRFALAGIVLLAGCLLTGRSIRLTRAQHLTALGQGVLTFSVQYSLVYFAEQHVNSAVVAVIFAAMAFTNIVLFRLLLGQKAAPMAWLGAGLGAVGVALLSFAELRQAGGHPGVMLGIGCSVVAMLIASTGNLMAWRNQQLKAGVLQSTGWAMIYGATGLTLWALVTGVPWRFEATAAYVGSLLYLSLFGSVIAFALYFWLARARSYALASYIGALTPPLAMLISVVLEGARFGPSAVLGLLVVLAGQVLLIRAPRA